MVSTLKLDEPSDKIAVLNGVYAALVNVLNGTVQAVERVALTICSVLLAFVGWFLTAEIDKTGTPAIYFAISPLVLGILGCLIAKRLESRYHQVAHSINRINLVQRVTEPGIFLDSQTLFPEEWVKIIVRNSVHEQQRQSPEPTFRLAIWAIGLVSVFCTAAVVFVSVSAK